MSISVSDFKTYFDRGQFTYGVDLPSIRDKDITSAIAEAEAIFNEGIYPSEDSAKQALYYLTAHFLQLDTESVDSGGQTKLLQNSRSADGISEGLSIPEWMNQGEFAFYATTYYGQKFIILTKPYLDGAVFVVNGGTLP